MTEIEEWKKQGDECGWEMPNASAWKRLPFIRHIRTIFLKFKIEQHYSSGIGYIGLRSGYDDWVLFGIWHGMETEK